MEEYCQRARKQFVPVLVNVWPLYDAHKRFSSSNSPLSSSSLLQLKRSRKFFHSSGEIHDQIRSKSVVIHIITTLGLLQ